MNISKSIDWRNNVNNKKLRYEIKLLREDYFEDSEVYKVLTEILNMIPKNVKVEK